MFSVRLLAVSFLCASMSTFGMEKPLCVLVAPNGKKTEVLINGTHFSLAELDGLKEAHLHNCDIKTVNMPSDEKFSLPELRSLSITNSKIETFNLEGLIKIASRLGSLDLSNNKCLSDLTISNYNHTNLGYIGLNNTVLSKEQINKLKGLIEGTQNSRKPLIAAATYSFVMPKITRSCPEVPLYNE